MKKFLGILIVALLAFVSVDAMAQTRKATAAKRTTATTKRTASTTASKATPAKIDKPFKGTFTRINDGRQCTLVLDAYCNSINSSGWLKEDAATGSIESLSEYTDFKCKGILEYYVGGYESYNVLSCKINGLEAVLTLAPMDSNDIINIGCIKIKMNNDGSSLALTTLDSFSFQVKNQIFKRKK